MNDYIRKAERDLAAATVNIGAAESQPYPSITLNGSISPSSIKQAGSAAGGLTTWLFRPALNPPIFGGDRLRPNVEMTRSNAKVQSLAWKQIVLAALEEVERALSSVHRDAQTIQALRAQVKTTQETLALSIGSYKDGQSSLLDVLDAQRSAATSQANLAQAVQQTAKNYVTLNVAIGSGYNFGGAAIRPNSYEQ
jgi:multidrug efflux system outer membrane protein